ncbi:AfsR/SARP family transcriptional regulator [Blastococcus tunisiensis]|uniref:DNA-binding transcriptional activator of the SARP family n=1 Tax=Blastococcus tunisiensis TaxID=1798228 RepID=A0A1I2BYH8_9ACTN|nr:hypothetical protein [Blastococcus sp. DSM 46838]SFE60513.1 DNA-binding transcriptional activator of the SARP family [Blastococcus sp. DSM 46838]
MDLRTDPSIPLVRVLGGLSLHHGGQRTALPAGSHRLLAHLALHPAGVDRRSVAAALWPTADDDRATGNLRTAVWCLQQVGCALVQVEPTVLRLRADVETDLAGVEAWAERVLAGAATPEDLAVDAGAIAALELLPGWSEDWVLLARERLHLHRSRALAALGVPAAADRCRAGVADQAAVSVRVPPAPVGPADRRAAAARMARALVWRRVSAR